MDNYNTSCLHEQAGVQTKKEQAFRKPVFYPLNYRALQIFLLLFCVPQSFLAEKIPFSPG